MTKRVSISDIAQSLGVSKTLVSLVLNDKSSAFGISKETQRKVLEKVKELNYKPNLMARNLRLGKTNTLGLIVSDISNPFYSRIARYIEDIAELHGYNLFICSTDEKVSKEIALTKMLRDRQVDGLILSSSQKDGEELLQILGENFPLVLIDRFINGFDANYISVDNFKGSYYAVEHLIKQKRKRIAAFAISPIHVSTISDRVQGYLQALRDNEQSYGSEFLIEIPFNNVKEAVYEYMKKLTVGSKKIDGLFAINNNIALACLEYINEEKISVPSDLSLVCFDDVDLFKLTNPTITSVAQPLEEMCTSAMEMLFDSIQSKTQKEKKHIVLPTKLIIRRSTVV